MFFLCRLCVGVLLHKVLLFRNKVLFVLQLKCVVCLTLHELLFCNASLSISIVGTARLYFAFHNLFAFLRCSASLMLRSFLASFKLC